MEHSVEPAAGPSVRRLVLFRHAKSERPPGVEDHERPLAARGHRDAEAAGRWLAEQGLVPDLVLCSDALRARQTWESAAEGLRNRTGGDPEVRYARSLYQAGVHAVVNLAAETGDEVFTLLVVGHEPTMSEVAVALAGPASDEALVADVRAHLPTSGLVVLEQPGSWQDIESGSAALTGLAAPRG
jgi:phosphohistidine phosphatase